ncbi:ABC transporter permease [Enterococcus sp. AZ072]|uniref:ABC transporter permease n=1 Tax=unclassified Enterococcus TaxID=2608891 RepID=UPI003D28972A
MSLVIKEMKITLKSMTFWVVILLIGLFAFSQIGSDLTMIKEPKPNEEEYGLQPTKDPKKIQESTYQQLFPEYINNSYATYPLGFLKSVRLSNNQQKEIEKILTSASEMSIDELTKKYQESITSNGQTVFSFPVKKGYSYKEFQQNMHRAEKIIGKGSNFEEKRYKSKAVEPKTYQQAHKDFQKIVEEDQVSGAYARMVCDYFGIILALVPVFLAATVIVRDKRAQAQQVIFTKQTSTAKLIISRYFSCILLLVVPILLFVLMPGMQSLTMAKNLHAQGNLLLFYQYVLGWLIPTILAVVGIGFLLTELAGGIVAILAQLLFWLANLFMNGGSITGSAGWNLIPRFNEVGQRDLFSQMLPELIANRIFWSVMGIICCLLTVLLADYKRKGGALFGKDQ